ncbi:TIGR02206 family membrane protein [Mycoplasmatota bacterium zrk1]
MFLDFFREVPNPAKSVQMFTPLYFFIITLLILSIIILVKYAKKIKESKYEEFIRYIIFIIMFTAEFYFIFFSWIKGEWSFPLHLCGLCVIMTLILLITKNYNVFETVFFIGISGGIVAFIIPDNGGYGFDNIRFYAFFFNRLLIILVPLYFKIGYDFVIRKDTLIKTSLFVIIAWLINFAINTFLRSLTTLKANYMFTHELPKSLVGFFPKFPWYIFIFGMIAFLMFLSIYLATGEKVPFAKKIESNH